MEDYNIWYQIFHLLELKTQIAVLFICNTFKNNLHITNLYDNQKGYKSLLTSDILENNIFASVTKIKLFFGVEKIFKLKNLRKIDARKYVSFVDINGLNLTKLKTGGYCKIDALPSMKNLKVLYVWGSASVVDQNMIAKLDLVKLDVDYNEFISDVSFMRNLKILSACATSQISQDTIDKLDLIELRANHNRKIKNVAFMKNLKVLGAKGDCGIDQAGISGLNLWKLDISGNDKIIDVSFMKNLKILDITRCTKITDDSIRGLNIIELYYKP